MTGLRIGADTSLPLDFITQSSAILAKKGAGKTNAAIVLLEEAYAAGVPVVSIDPKGDHWGVRAGADGTPEGGLPLVVFGGLHADVPLEPTAGVYVAELIRSTRLSAVLDVSEFTIGERARFLTAFADRLYRYDSRDPMLLILEEAHEYIPQRVSGEEAKMVGAFERLVKLGRSKGLGVVMVTQRSASLNKNVLTQADNLFVLRTTSPQDRDVVKAWISTNDQAASVLGELPSLQSGECWLWAPETNEDPIKFRFRMRHTYDAGATPKVGESPRPPATLADVDLAAVTEAMSATIEKAKADDPKVLKARVAELEKLLREQPAGERVEVPVEVVREVEKVVEVPLLSDAERETLAEIEGMLKGLSAVLPLHTGIVQKVHASSAPAPAKVTSVPRPAIAKALIAPSTGRLVDDEVKFRAGAQRMIETLGRMYPLHLTKAQWGTVSAMKTTSGTWSTYFGELKRAGFIDQDSAGFFLTDAGFDYLGGRPDPMTPEELQQHYRSILRAGAVRMLDAVIAAYPGSIEKADLGEQIEMSTASGTFSTYLGELVRNGLADKVDGGLRATDVLMKGAAA